MMNPEEHMGMTAKAAGLKVKSMIETVEQKMAGGETVPAGPASEEEARVLENVRNENRKSKDSANNA